MSTVDFVLPEYQGKGIGTSIVNYLLEYIKKHTAKGDFTSVGLTAAEGKESFCLSCIALL